MFSYKGPRGMKVKGLFDNDDVVRLSSTDLKGMTLRKQRVTSCRMSRHASTACGVTVIRPAHSRRRRRRTHRCAPATRGGSTA